MGAVATFVKDVEGLGSKKLYRVEPPLETGPFVLSSAVDLPILISDYRTSETMVFPADESGEVTDWGEIGFAPHKSHEDALADAGFEVAS